MKLIKFDLPINGIKVKNLDELRDNLTDEILALARSSQLERWLRTRKLSEQAEAVATAVRSEDTDKGLFLALCEVLEVEAHPDDVKAIFDVPLVLGNFIHKARYFEMYETLKRRLENEKNIKKKKSAITHSVDREQLLHSFRSLQVNFEIAHSQAKIHENYFQLIYEGFARRFSNHLEIFLENTRSSEEASRAVKILEKIKIDLDRKVAGREKSVKFRENFQDSLLVFINGKVKSGKSSLGNYMAWGHTDPDAALKARTPKYLQPKYFSGENNNVDGGDAKGEAEDRSEFRVGATEATSSIQGFKLPGLTWVDSPGLHSVKKENEDLARDYVEHADLILYTMKSDAPGRASDLAEIQQLLGKEKKVLLLLTGSDDVEEDFDDETDNLVQTVVMKDAKRREKQHAYVREALRELANGSGDSRIENLEIVSISARYAQLNADDPAAFSQSGMGMLYETLHRITQSEGIRIKQRTPIAGLHNFLEGCYKDLNPYLDLLFRFKRKRLGDTIGSMISGLLMPFAVEQPIEIKQLLLEFSDFELQLRRMLQITRNT